MQTIYVDVLIVLNIYVNFILLKAAAKLTHSPLGTRRCIGAASVGSLFSLIILAPELGVILGGIYKLVSAAAIVLLAFGKRRILLNTVIFFASGYLAAGAVYAFYSFFCPQLIHFCNTFFYIDLSLIALVISTALVYFCVCAVRFFCDREPIGSFRIFVRYGCRIAAFDGLADSGNLLVDFFTGCPVIICGKSGLGSILRTDEPSPKGMRPLPCSTVNGSDAIMIFRPDEVVITDKSSGLRKSVDVLIGISHETDKAIFNPKILKY